MHPLLALFAAFCLFLPVLASAQPSSASVTFRFSEALKAFSRINHSPPPYCPGDFLQSKPRPSDIHSPIVFELNGQKKLLPIVGAYIHQRHCWFILDAGSNSNVISKSMAAQLGLQGASIPEASGLGHFGDPIPYCSLSPFSMKLDGSTEALDEIKAISMDLPDHFEKEGICGLLSPQAINPRGTTVLDFLSNQLEIRHRGNSTPAVESLQSLYPKLEFSSLELISDKRSSDYSSRVMLVEASLAGKAKQRILLDTGAGNTHFPPEYVKAARTHPGPKMQSSSGQVIQTQAAEDQMLVIGNRQVSLPELFLLPKQPNADGVIGMDVLKQSVLVITPDADQVDLGFPPK